MKYKVSILIGTVIASLFLSLSFGVGKVHATTGCFTDTIGHPFETFICWMLEKGITSGTSPGIYSPSAFVTRGQMAVFMKRQAEIPPTTGDIYINAGPIGWAPDNYLPGSVTSFSSFDNGAYLTATTTGSHYYALSPTLPSSLYNTRMIFKGVKLCYNASYGAPITGVTLSHLGSSGIILTQVLDYTVRSDSTCVTEYMSTPWEIYGGDFVILEVRLSITNISQAAIVRSATFILSPSAYPAVLSPVEARPVPGDAVTVP